MLEKDKKTMKKQQLIINKLLKKPENKFCSDCKTNPPSWASINLGVFICMDCSGCHRELGTHISKIKSINLDSWNLETLEYFKKIDNKIANDYWEYNLQNFDFSSLVKDRDNLMDFIRDKYEYKKWVKDNDIDPMTKIIQESGNVNNNQNNVYNQIDNNGKEVNQNNFGNFNWDYFNQNK